MSEQIKPGPAPDPPPSPTGPPVDDATCPHCGARRITSAPTQCWLCYGALPPQKGPLPMGKPLKMADSGPMIVLGVLIVVIAAVMTIEIPGVLIILGLLALPAVFRAVATAGRARTDLTGGQKWGLFFSSLGVVALMGLAAAITFSVTCVAVCFGVAAVSSNGFRGLDTVFGISIVAGSIIALLAFALLYRKYWPRKTAP